MYISKLVKLLSNDCKIVLKITSGEWINASRDKRELQVAQELGAQVLVMAKGKPHDNKRFEKVDGFDVYRYSTRPLGLRIPNNLNRIISIFIWSWKARSFHADVISGHDLIPLFIGYLSTLFQSSNRRACLIYDSHEFELGRNTLRKRNRFTFWWIKNLERYLMNRCISSIIPCDSAADEVVKIHRLKSRPVVVRNIPSFWELNTSLIDRNRNTFCNQLGLPTTRPNEGGSGLLMYHGAVVPGRGIENLIRTLELVTDVGLVIFGSCSREYQSSLQYLAEQLGIVQRIIFHPYVPLEQLKDFIAAVDCGVIPIAPTSRSYFLSLPNKYFECIQSLTPIIHPNFPEMSRITNQYGIGLTCDTEYPKNIARAIDTMLQDKESYAIMKENLKTAKEELCWEHERERIVEVYKIALSGEHSNIILEGIK